MPPVLRPVSPSPTRLWSCAPTRGIALPPPTTAKKDASSPSRKSSTTISAPAEPNAEFTIMSSTASRAVWTSIATMTPLPAASPSVLTTMGAPSFWMYFLAASGSVKRSYFAVGMLYFLRRSLRKPLEPSSLAASLVGPKHGMSAAMRASAMPSTRGASGPTTTRPTLLSLQNLMTAAWSDSLTSTT